MCYHLDGEGGKVGPDLTVESARGRTEEWLMGHFKGPADYTPGSIMPAFKNLTDDQLKALATFLENQGGVQDRERKQLLGVRNPHQTALTMVRN